jgi:aerobic-type carbon monoxide dehydrogenase small subunit (CoxS/CutS family)
MYDEEPKRSAEDAGADEAEHGVSRRGFLRTVGGGIAATTLAGAIVPAVACEARDEAEAGAVPEAEAVAPSVTSAVAKLSVALTVNGKKQTASVDPRRTLLDLLRNDLDLTGTKKVCDRGSCGACTVIKDGEPVYACMTLAVECEGAKVETVESLAKGDRYHPLQVAFVEHDALMCGFCTPGFLMASKALLDRNKKPSLDDVKSACAGNICRCGTYPRIFDAVLDASKKGNA